MNCIFWNIIKNRLKKYFEDREKIVDSAKRLQSHLVKLVSPFETDPVKGFNRITQVNKSGKCNIISLIILFSWNIFAFI